MVKRLIKEKELEDYIAANWTAVFPDLLFCGRQEPLGKFFMDFHAKRMGDTSRKGTHTVVELKCTLAWVPTKGKGLVSLCSGVEAVLDGAVGQMYRYMYVFDHLYPRWSPCLGMIVCDELCYPYNRFEDWPPRVSFVDMHSNSAIGEFVASRRWGHA